MIGQKKCIIISAIGVILLTSIIITIVFATKSGGNDDENPKPDNSPLASKYKRAAVATDAEICSNIGVNILKQNGSAADAAIAAMFCTGTINLHSCGIGGGSYMVLYERVNKTFIIYDFRETAPAAANETMFVNRSSMSVYGGLAIATPSQIKGMWTVHQKHGKLPWATLIEPSIKLAKDGFKVTKPVDAAIKRVMAKSELSQGLKEIITKADGTFLKEGDLLKNVKYADTLKAIQNDAMSFYDGELAKKVVADIAKVSGIITAEDLKNYTIKQRNVIKLKLPNELTLNTMSSPGGGPVLAMIHNIMSGYDLSKIDLSKLDDQVDYYQKVIESMKFSYAQRGYLGDPDFLPSQNITDIYKIVTNLTVGELIRKNKLSMSQTHEPPYYGGYWGKDDYGTSHMSILAENGDAVSCTSTINYIFGSLVRSTVTGILYNNQMDDFSTPGQSNLYGYPPTPANYIRPGKRPLSSMSPSIVVDKNGDVKMIAGASGGSRIISGTTQVMIKKLFLGMELGKAVASYRVHHQGIPNEISYNTGNPPPSELLNRLKAIGHKTKATTSGSVVQAIYKDGVDIYAMSDPRKHSKAAGY